ncbi:uncharacterized protein TM35_001111070, partial [Trypanosoma theileri]
MIKVVMVRCYLLCLLTLALCCACGLVWADGPKACDALIKLSTVGVNSLVRRAIPAFIMCDGEDKEDDECHCKKEEDGDTEDKENTVSRDTGELGSSTATSSRGTDELVGAPGSKQQGSKTPEQLK